MVESVYKGQANALLSQIRAHQERVDLIRSDAPVQRPEPGSESGFVQYVQEAVESVNATTQESAALRDAYERGEDVPLTHVVLAMQKSSLAFEATLQVRNKLMKAYEEIKNMPV